MIFYLDKQEKTRAVFTNNGSPGSCPYYDDVLKENLDTGASSFEFAIPTNHDNADIIEDNGYIVTTNLDGDLIMFSIIQIEDIHGSEKRKYIVGENAGLELLNDIFRPTANMSKSVDQILDIVLANTRWERGVTEYFGVENFEFSDYANVYSVLQSVKAIFGGELNFRVKKENGVITKRYVDLVAQRGTVTKKRFVYNKDVKSVRRTIDMRDVVTALIGLGKGGSGGENLTFKSVSYSVALGKPFNKPLNRDWIGDDDALQRYGNKGRHLFGISSYETSNPEELLLLTWKELQERKTPTITYDLDVALLERLTGLDHEQVRLGDTIYVVDQTFSPELLLEARVRQLETYFSDPSKDKCVLGNYKIVKSNITPEMRMLQQKLLKKESTWDDIGTKIYPGPLPPATSDNSWEKYDLTQTWEEFINGPIYN